MDKLDVVAYISLRELAKREKLQAIIHQPAYQYYFQGGIIGVLAGLCGVAFLIWLLFNHNIPTWGAMAIGLAFVAYFESMRNRDRLDALIELKEIEDKMRSEQGVAGYPPQGVGSPER